MAALPSAAAAQTSANDKAAAEALFDRGLELMRQGKDAEACATLERSQAIERGVGTMLYLAECYEKVGRTASAWALYREAASAAQAQGQAERAKAGAARADHLTPLLSKLTLVVPPGVAVPGLAITRNGSEVPSAAYGVGLPVDPGQQQLTAAAPGYEPWSLRVNLPPNGAALTVEIPSLQALPPEATPAEPMQPPSAASAPQTSLAVQLASTDGQTSASGFHKPLAYALGGAGIVALGLGSYFGLKAISENKRADEACPGGRCDAQGFEHDRAAHHAATAANVLLAGGLALAAAGVVVYVTRPRKDRPHVGLTAAPGLAQLSLQGNF